MGVGNSKLNAAEEEGVPAKIRPILVGRVEEFRKRRNGESTLSKKKLLNEEDDNSQYSRKIETQDKNSLLKEIEPPKEETVARVTTAEKLSRVVPMSNSECEIPEENQPNKDSMEQVNQNMDPNQNKLNRAVVVDDDESDDDDESEEVGRFLCPGSPSFKIYCIEAEKRNEEECNCPTIFVHQKSQSVETAATTNSTDVLYESESTPKRKVHKKKFGAMRTLLKVKSLYHPMCTCIGDDKNLIVTTKATK